MNHTHEIDRAKYVSRHMTHRIYDMLLKVLSAVLALPIVAWVCPRLLGSPRFNDQPSYYLTAVGMGVVVVYVGSWVWKKVRAIVAL